MRNDFQDLLREFQGLVSGPPEALTLDRGSLLIARSEYPAMDHARYLAEFDRLAAKVRSHPTPLDSIQTLETMNTVLIEEEGYRGNEEDYYDPRNSYINDVMERKLGIPISLSLIYLEVARRLKFPLVGVSFPGRFLLRYEGQGQELYVDPFQRGEFLVAGDLPARLSQLVGEGQTQELMKKHGGRLPASLLSKAAPAEILMRMLANLREIHLRRRDLQRARHIVALVMTLGPQSREARDSVAALRKIEAALN